MQHFYPPYYGAFISLAPYTSEYFLASTGSIYALSTGLFSDFSDSRPSRVFLSLENANMRYKLDGGTPATGCGHLFVAGDYLQLDNPIEVANFKIMNEVGTNTAYLYATYFRVQ